MINAKSPDYFSLAQDLQKQGNINQAIALYEKAIALNPELFVAYQNLGDIYADTNQLEQALTYYQSAEKLQPKSWLIFQKIGNIFLKKEDFITAAIYFQRSIDLNPNFPWSHHNLGIVMEKLGLFKQAIFYYEKLVDLNPDFVGGYQRLVNIQEELGDSSQLIQNYQKIIELKPDAWWIYQKLAVLLENQGEIERAITIYQQAIKLNPELVNIYYELGKIYDKLNNKSDLIATYQKIIELKPESWQIYKKLAVLLMEQGNLDKAINICEKVIKLNDYFPWLYENLGKIYIKQKKWDQAIKNLIKSLQIQPDNYFSYQEMAKIFYHHNQKKEAQMCQRHILPASIIHEYYNLPDNYHILSSDSPDVDKIIIYSPKTITFPASKSIEINLPKSLSQQTKISPESFVAILPSGRAWADRFTSVVFTRDDLFVEDISTGSPELIISSNNLSPIEFIDGTVVFLSARWGYNTYYHWMLDIVSRFDLLQRNNININDIDRFVFNRTDGNYRQECLQALGIPNEKIIESQFLPHIQAKNLIVPSLPTLVDGGFRTHIWVCQFLRNLFLPNPCIINTDSQTYPQRIYISRSKSQYRHVINETELIHFLSQEGFHIVHLESLSVQEQALCLYHANIVISAHGAGLTNLVFCQAGTKVIEIFAPEYVPACYKEISHISNLVYYYLLGDKFSESKAPLVNQNVHDPLRKNILVNIKKFQKLLKFAGIT